MSNKVKKKKKINKVNLWATIVSIVAVIGLIGLIGGIAVIAALLRNKPILNVSDFDQQESSIVYDSRGEEIANLGTVIRQNIEYDEIPNCVVDAFVAIEDSRYFQHNGFDVPRFTKAILENIRTMSFGQGGSTFTMQLVKNTYFTDDETGEQAARSGARGVRRKVQEIALALELENAKSKQDIFESYVNKLNFGGSNNIRGIQKAAQYYFGKDLANVNLVEGALLAGVINAPNYYNPFYNLEAAQERVTEVLYQMRNHGYISKAEYELAKSIRVEDLLKDPFKSDSEGDGIPYQAYIDQVVSEVMELTNLDPYTTTMHIYTYMNRDIQEEMDNIQAGNMDPEYLQFPDDYFECASVCIKNSTGEVVGIMGGRNYANGGQLLLNHATEQYKQPGSTIKPILDYALAFENLGWATDHVLTDKPMFYDDVSKIVIQNDSGTYVGDVTLKQAVGQSINTCAIQALQSVLDAKKYEYVVNYAQSLGYKFNLDDFDIQYAIGGNTCEVTPYQHAAAYAAIMNYGVYNKPHTISRIEFTNGKSPVTPVYTPTQVLSEAASFLTTELMYSNVQNYGGSYSFVKNDEYPVYGKTGTTDYGNTAQEYGIPSGSIKDGWLVAATSEYTTATWCGYEKAVIGQPSYISRDYYYNDRPQGKLAHLILEAAYRYGDSTPVKLEKPSGVSSITHVIGTWPYAAFTEGMDESLRTTGLIKSDSVKLVSLATPKVADISDFDISVDSALTMRWAEYPDKSKLETASGVKDISLRNSSGEVIIAASGTCLFDYTKLYGPIKYMADVTVNGKTEHIKSDDDKKSVSLHANPGDKVKVEGYYAFESGSFSSNKISKEATVTASIKIPTDASQSRMEEWSNQYDFITFKTEATSNHDLLNKKYKVTDQNGNELQQGTSITVDNSSFRLTVTYYREKDHTLSIVATSSGNGMSIKLVPQFDADSSFESWDLRYVPDVINSSVSGDNSLTLTLKADAYETQFVVTANTDYKSANITIFVHVSEDGKITISDS
ncbi:MAG: transglycosylase domain-containing protein [Erysipelotrichaceae bacterium]|nr:transglycosylase domain-containing protein [Erysipelotrichaceae bacterium]